MSKESGPTKPNKLSEIRGKLEGKLDSVKLKIKKTLPLLHSSYVAVTTSINREPREAKNAFESQNKIGRASCRERV